MNLRGESCGISGCDSNADDQRIGSVSSRGHAYAIYLSACAIAILALAL
jgi:hypothetical protein